MEYFLLWRLVNTQLKEGAKMKNELIPFEDYSIRRVYDETTETWFFSVVDIIQVLIQQSDYQAARNYWKVLKNRLKNEGSESVTNCNRLKRDSRIKCCVCKTSHNYCALTQDVKKLIQKRISVILLVKG